MTTMNMDEVMGNRDYTLIIDGTAPMGMAKYRYEPTKEVVYVVINEAMANNTNKEETTMNNTNNNATINTNTQEDKAMNKNNTQATTNNTNNRKEKKNMKKRIGFIGNMIIAGALAASKGTGYGVGYATETVKDEACYYGKKVKDAVASTKMAQNFTDGYYDGKNDAMTAFDCRVAEREFKAEQKKNAKTNLDAAVDELMDEFEDFDDSVCGDGVWNAQ
jgi:hypothetical protein